MSTVTCDRNQRPMTNTDLSATPTAILQHDGRWWSFAGFERAVVAWRADEVAAAVREVERAVEEDGLLAAGYLAYAAAAASGLSVRVPTPDGPPLLW
ncbi:MAG: hypothetical protein KBG73_04150, partial [Candidatus Promineofilum sp.]|nr:hypothetical protein [Promineifilum sp.]